MPTLALCFDRDGFAGHCRWQQVFSGENDLSYRLHNVCLIADWLTIYHLFQNR